MACVVERNGSWFVVNSKGNPQSGPYPTAEAAMEHLPAGHRPADPATVPTKPKRKFPKSKSVRTTSGGLPTLGKRR